ncbi:hypothetical protein M758_6G091700 [Ceratodon purpureus]|nr:hypothetical protein M758_6G091700 [Ceratodon purpureus]
MFFYRKGLQSKWNCAESKWTATCEWVPNKLECVTDPIQPCLRCGLYHDLQRLGRRGLLFHYCISFKSIVLSWEQSEEPVIVLGAEVVLPRSAAVGPLVDICWVFKLCALFGCVSSYQLSAGLRCLFR